MSKYLLITVVKGSLGNAGPKAPLDICHILEETGLVETISWSSEQGRDYPLFLEVLSVLKKIKDEQRTVILQYPFQPFHYHEKQELYSELMKYLNTEKTWIWMHDINQIRFDMDCYKNEMQWLKPFKNFIVHNNIMENYLRERLDVDNCICNEVFDYICGKENSINPVKWINKEQPDIVYAGNLAVNKSPFLYDLKSYNMNFNINVYGKREKLILNSKINYCGSFKADVLPGKLRGSIGLIWDGETDATQDTSMQRNYTRYNTPHKFSCYIAAGLPVIAWKEAAIASVIQKYQVGYLIENIYDINHLDWSEYEQYQRNAMALSEKIRNGYFTKKVFEYIVKSE